MTDELVTFLQARLDEDEQLRRAARSWSDRDWTINTVSGRVTIHADEADVVAWIEHEGEPGQHIAEFITRHDPGRIRDDIDGKRRIIAEYEQAADFYSHNLHAPVGEAHGLRTALQFLATAYRKHPDYRSEWAPDAS